MNQEKEKLEEYYKKGNVTKTYDSQREGTEYRRQKRQKELEIFLEFIDLDKRDNEKVLELGCSSGFLTRHLGEVTAIDTSKEMLQITKERNPKAKVLEADMFNLPFKDKSFDKIVVMRVWNHLDEKDLKLALKEAKRVLNKPGFLIFDMEEKNWLRRFIHFFYKKIFRITGFKIHQYSIEELKKILNEEDFRWERFTFINHRVGKQIIFRVQN